MYIYYNYYGGIQKEIDRIIAECAKLAAQENYKIKFISNGWLKPHKQLKPFSSHSKITYNLPRGRIREKKQIFRQAA